MKEKSDDLMQDGQYNAIITGEMKIDELPVAIGVMNIRYMMASIGHVVREIVTRLFEKAIKKKTAAILFCCLGGVRMQEDIISLMQMEKTAYVVNCYQLNTLDEKVYELFKKVVCKQRLEKSHGFVFDIDAKRCVCAGILLQYSFFKCIGTMQIPEIHCNKYGKPYFIDETRFHFNLTHSGNWVGIAYGRNNVGLDIEKVVDEKNYLSYSFLTDKEKRILRNLSDEVQVQQLVRLWTIKESYVKWLGTGLSTEMNSFSINIDNVVDDFWDGKINGEAKWKSLLLDKNHYLSLCGTEKDFFLNIITADELLDFALFSITHRN